MESMKIHMNIKQLRVERGFTQGDIAAGINKSQSAYGRIESGESSLIYTDLEKIAEFLGLTVVDIIFYPEKWVIPGGTDKKNTELSVKANTILLEHDEKERRLELYEKMIHEYIEQIKYLRKELEKK